MKVKPFIILAISLTAAHRSAGQKAAGDTVLKGSTIEVIQSYKPVVKKAPKPDWLPQLPPADTARPAMTFDVPQQTLYYSYTSSPLRPLALGKDSLVVPFPNYIKAGAGNLSTLYLDAGIGGLRGADYQLPIHLHHLSQKGSIKGQQTSLSGLEAEGFYKKGKNDLHSAFSVERNQYYYYGYNHAQHDYANDSIKQTFTGVHLEADAARVLNLGGRNIVFHPEIEGNIYAARYNTTETGLGIKAPFSYRVDSALELMVALNASFTRLKTPYMTDGNNLVGLYPGLALHTGKVTGHGILGFAAGKDGNVFVLPDIQAHYNIAGTALRLSGGWQASVRRNTYEQLTMENPYIVNAYTVKQTRRDEIFANLAGAAGAHITYTARVSWWNFNALPVYLNHAGAAADSKQFDLLYNDVSAFSLRGGARYTETDKWSAGATAEFYNYYQGTLAHVWHEPTFRLRADLSVTPLKDLTIMAYGSVTAGMYAVNAAGQAVTLQPNTDIGINGEYRLISRLTAFLQVDNLLNSKYERWLGYQAYGINIYGGLRLKF
ncbi:MAG: hypothetical protein H7257_08720 [Taibaiella sp.]|nr:hypothetical protein [Taibaiella sp.]